METILNNALAAIMLRAQLMSGESQPDLSNPDDRAATLELFARIKSRGASLVPEEVEQSALDNGWFRAAKELRDLSVVAVFTPNLSSILHSAFWQEDIVEVLGAEDSGRGVPLYQADSKCNGCTLWRKGATEFGGCLLNIMRTQWAEPYWLAHFCISPDARPTKGVASEPLASSMQG